MGQWSAKVHDEQSMFCSPRNLCCWSWADERSQSRANCKLHAGDPIPARLVFRARWAYCFAVQGSHTLECSSQQQWCFLLFLLHSLVLGPPTMLEIYSWTADCSRSWFLNPVSTAELSRQRSRTNSFWNALQFKNLYVWWFWKLVSRFTHLSRSPLGAELERNRALSVSGKETTIPILWSEVHPLLWSVAGHTQEKPCTGCPPVQLCSHKICHFTCGFIVVWEMDKKLLLCHTTFRDHSQEPVKESVRTMWQAHRSSVACRQSVLSGCDCFVGLAGYSACMV